MKNWILTFIFVSALMGVPLTADRGFCGESYKIKEMTPPVRQALDNRKNRFAELKQLKEKGVVGENNRGYVEALTNDPAAKALVDAENKDRAFIYKTIVEQNNLPPDALTTVESVFAQLHRDKAHAGYKIQQPNGEWKTK